MNGSACINFRVIGRRHRRGRSRCDLDHRAQICIGSDGEKLLVSPFEGLESFAVGFLKWFSGQLEARLLTEEEAARRSSPSRPWMEETAHHGFVLRRPMVRGELSIDAEEAALYRMSGADLPYLWEERAYQGWLQSRAPSAEG